MKNVLILIMMTGLLACGEATSESTNPGGTDGADGGNNDNGGGDSLSITINENPSADQLLTTVSLMGTPYTLSDESQTGAFAVDATSGAIRVKTPYLFDYETTSGELTASIAVGNGTLTPDIVNITVTLTDVAALTVGNNDSQGFSKVSAFNANELAGTRYTLNEGGRLVALGLIVKNPGTFARMALFADEQGQPGTLLATTLDRLLETTGPVLLPLFESIELEAGDYWVMATYATSGEPTYQRPDTESETIYSGSIASFSVHDIPSNGSAFQSSQGGAFTYYLELETP